MEAGVECRTDVDAVHKHGLRKVVPKVERRWKIIGEAYGEARKPYLLRYFRNCTLSRSVVVRDDVDALDAHILYHLPIGALRVHCSPSPPEMNGCPQLEPPGVLRQCTFVLE